MMFLQDVTINPHSTSRSKASFSVQLFRSVLYWKGLIDLPDNQLSRTTFRGIAQTIKQESHLMMGILFRRVRQKATHFPLTKPAFTTFRDQKSQRNSRMENSHQPEIGDSLKLKNSLLQHIDLIKSRRFPNRTQKTGRKRPRIYQFKP